MKKIPKILALLLAALACGVAIADNFWDQGFKDGAWRTDFISDLAGTSHFVLTATNNTQQIYFKLAIPGLQPAYAVV